MYDKVLFEKIINVDCSFDELESFGRRMNENEFDLDDAFGKYYDVERIFKAINRYENREINDRYLAHWANAYNWIIRAGFKTFDENAPITFREWVIWEISDLLDASSFFDSSYKELGIGKFKKSFRLIDEIYRNIGDWDCVFSHTGMFGDNEDDVVLLIVNHKAKEFVKIYSNIDYLNEKVDIKMLEPDESEKVISVLKSSGYRKLKYGF